MSQNPVPNPPNPVPQDPGAGNPYYNSPYRIITQAMRNAKLIPKRAVPTSEDLAEYMNTLQDFIFMLQTRGLKLWLQEDVAFTPIAGTNLYSFGPTGTVTQPRPPRILEAYYQDSNNVRRPLIVLSRNEWDTLSTLTTEGAINSYFVDKQQLVTNFYTWLTPDTVAATGTVHTLQQVTVNSPFILTGTMNFPQEWFMLLHWGFAYNISNGQPQAVIDMCKNQYGDLLDVAEGWDVEDTSTMFQPDQRLQFVGNRFK